jgi:proteic killer suppression protein
MEILFDDKNLADTKKRRGKFSTIAKQIEKRLVQLQSAKNLAVFGQDYPGARCHEYSGDEKGTYTVDLTGNYRLRFRPSDCPPPLKTDGGIDKTQVFSITVFEVFDPHKR